MLPKFFSLFLLGIGVFILVQVIMPVLSFKLWEISLYNQNISLISSDPDSVTVLGVSIQNNQSLLPFGTSDNFPAFISNSRRATPPLYKEFTITIPSIKLENVKVVVDTNDFEKNLAHLPGSVLPGERGNVFITGHSSLPQLFRQGNFKAVFANLPQMKTGDEIMIEASGQTFSYQVKGLQIVDPKQTWVINPPDEKGRYLTLMTCVPPGLYLKRLIVLSELQP